MIDMTRAVGLAATSLLVLSAVGCVESEASIEVRGIVAFEGSLGSSDVECPVAGGGGGDEQQTETRSQLQVTCNKQVEPGSVTNFLTSASFDISEFRRMGGQLGTAQRSVPDEQFCQMDPVTFEQVKYRHPWFEVSLDTVNRLQDSREVGAEGQGGGGGGFAGIKLDQNDIQIKEFKVRYPQIPETKSDNLGLDKDVRLNMLAESGGGGATMTFKLFNGGDVDALEKLHKTLVKRRAGLSTYNDRAKRTSVTVIAELWLKGQTIGERKVESNRVEFPITLCGQGCGVTPTCILSEEGGG